jgi:hypothetical protein
MRRAVFIALTFILMGCEKGQGIFDVRRSVVDIGGHSYHQLVFNGGASYTPTFETLVEAASLAQGGVTIVADRPMRQSPHDEWSEPLTVEEYEALRSEYLEYRLRGITDSEFVKKWGEKRFISFLTMWDRDRVNRENVSRDKFWEAE